MIDQLERVADWSQSQAALEGGAQSSFGSVGGSRGSRGGRDAPMTRGERERGSMRFERGGERSRWDDPGYVGERELERRRAAAERAELDADNSGTEIPDNISRREMQEWFTARDARRRERRAQRLRDAQGEATPAER